MGNKSSVQRSFDEGSLGQSPGSSPQCVVSKAAPETKGKGHAATSQRRRRSLLSLHNMLRKTNAEYREGHRSGTPSERPTGKPDESRLVSKTSTEEMDLVMEGSRSSTMMQKILPRVQQSSHEADTKISRVREVIATTESEKYDLSSKEEELRFRKRTLCPLSGPGGGNSPTEIQPYKTLVMPTRKGEQISIKDFDLLKVLGRGSFGKVMLVKKKSDGKLYAMKSLRKSTLIMKNQLMHMKTEREILQNMQHPFLVKLQYAFQSESKLYLVIDFVGGGELFFWLRKFKRFSEATARLFAAEMLLALECLHDHGVVYRDLKPENILIDARGHIKITDFGFCKQISRRSKNVECQCWRAAEHTNTFTGHTERTQVAHAPNKAISPKLDGLDSVGDTFNETGAKAGTGRSSDTPRTFGAESSADALSDGRSPRSEGSQSVSSSHSGAKATAIMRHGKSTDPGSDEPEKSTTQRPTTFSKRLRPSEPRPADLPHSPPVFPTRDLAQKMSPSHKLPARAGPQVSEKSHTNRGICLRCGKPQRNSSSPPREGSTATDTNAFATDVSNGEAVDDLARRRGRREDFAESTTSGGITVGLEGKHEFLYGEEEQGEEHHHRHHHQQQTWEQQQQQQRQQPREPDHVEEEEVEGSTSSFAGTPEYLAPEIIRRQRHGKAVDWWTLGALIFEMLTGLPPFYHRNRLRMYRRILQEPLVLPPTLSSAAKSLISSLLHRDANLRLGSRGGAAEIKAHPFFAGLDFDKVLRLQYRPPFLPPLDKDISELAFFDPECVAEPARDSPVVRKISNRSKMRIREVLRDFSYSGNITNAA